MTDLLSEAHGDPLPRSEDLPSLWERFNRAVALYPDKIALVSAYQPINLFGVRSIPHDDSHYTRWTYRDLKQAISRLTSGLRGLGITQGMPIITFLQNSVEYVLTLWAASELGCVLVPIDPRNLVNIMEVVHMIKTVLIYTNESPVFVVDSAELAKQVDTLSVASNAIKIVAREFIVDEWLPFSDLMVAVSANGVETQRFPGKDVKPSNETIFFTSGTTSLPKGCKWISSQISPFFERWFDLTPDFTSESVFCSVVPNNHGMGWASMVAAFCLGATVVFSGPVFTPDVVLRVMRDEKCTHTILVPTMVLALAAQATLQGEKLDRLENIMMGGGAVTQEVLRKCQDELGATYVVQVFGMTEGTFLCTGSIRDPNEIIKGNEVTVGKVPKGVGVKICQPDEKTPCARGVPGEVHYYGIGRVSGYIGKDTDDFYTDSQGHHWFKTGDQGVMDTDGRIFIVGRYKDMIIRGGENIAAAAVEAAITRNPRLAPLNIQIVGAPDCIAGEVPVAVTKVAVDADTAQEIRQTVLGQLGTAHVPDEVIALGTLGLQEYPRTVLGKVQKPKLTGLVRKYCEERENRETLQADQELQNIVQLIWAKATGLNANRVPLETPIAHFADSITLMKVRDMVAKQIKRDISLAEMVNAGTISAQIQLLKGRPSREANIQVATETLPQREGPPGPDDMVHLAEDLGLFESTVKIIDETLAKHGFCWQDVRDVMPVYDFFKVLTRSGLFDERNFKITILPNNKINAEKLRSALEAALNNNPMLTSFLVSGHYTLESDTALYVTLRQQKKLFDYCIIDGGTVDTIEDLRKLSLHYPYPNHAMFPGPLFSALVVHLKEMDSSALVANMNHAVMDASSAQLFFEDLDRVLVSPTTKLNLHNDYKLWADSYFSLRSSPAARAATKWHVKRLKDLAQHRNALFPPLPTAEESAHRREQDLYELDHSFSAASLQKLRSLYPSLTAPVIIKSALTLLNTYHTQHTHAVFANHEAARTSFPFLPSSLSHLRCYEATDIAGPTLSSVINLIEVKPDESVLAFVNRMQDDQTNLTRYASAPWQEIMRDLGPETGRLLPQVVRTQIFNWVPGMSATGSDLHANFKVLNAVSRPEVGLMVAAGMGGEDGCTVFLQVKGDGFEGQELVRFATELEAVVKWIVEERNWDEPVRGFRDAAL